MKQTLGRLRYIYRMYKLTRLCKRFHMQLLIDAKQTYKDPVFILHGPYIQVGLFLHERRVRLYVHVDQSNPFTLAHIIVQLCRLFTVEVRGTYKSKVDIKPSIMRKLSLVKEPKDDPTYH